MKFVNPRCWRLAHAGSSRGTRGVCCHAVSVQHGAGTRRVFSLGSWAECHGIRLVLRRRDAKTS